MVPPAPARPPDRRPASAPSATRVQPARATPYRSAYFGPTQISGPGRQTARPAGRRTGLSVLLALAVLVLAGLALVVVNQLVGDLTAGLLLSRVPATATKADAVITPGVIRITPIAVVAGGDQATRQPRSASCKWVSYIRGRDAAGHPRTHPGAPAPGAKALTVIDDESGQRNQ